MCSIKLIYKFQTIFSLLCNILLLPSEIKSYYSFRNRKWSNAIPLCAPISNYTSSSDALAMLNGDIDAMLSDAPADILRTHETPAILSPQSYKAAVTRAAVSRLLRRNIENYKNRVYRVNRLLRRDTER